MSSRDNERGARSARKKNIERLFSSSPSTTPLCWWSINLQRFIFYHPRSTDFEEKSQVTLTFFPRKSELKKTTALQLNSLMFEFEILTFLQGLNDLEYKKPKEKNFNQGRRIAFMTSLSKVAEKFFPYGTLILIM